MIESRDRIKYVGYLHSLAVRTGIGKKLLVQELAREFVFFLIPKYKFLSSREVNGRLLESDSSIEIENLSLESDTIILPPDNADTLVVSHLLFLSLIYI